MFKTINEKIQEQLGVLIFPESMVGDLRDVITTFTIREEELDEIVGAMPHTNRVALYRPGAWCSWFRYWSNDKRIGDQVSSLMADMIKVYGKPELQAFLGVFLEVEEVPCLRVWKEPVYEGINEAITSPAVFGYGDIIAAIREELHKAVKYPVVRLYGELLIALKEVEAVYGLTEMKEEESK